jgi:hypothetical protein
MGYCTWYLVPCCELSLSRAIWCKTGHLSSRAFPYYFSHSAFNHQQYVPWTDRSPLIMRLPGASWGFAMHYDAMHCKARIVLVIVLGTLRGERWEANVRATEDVLHSGPYKRFQTGDHDAAPGKLSDSAIQRMVHCLRGIVDELPASTGLRCLVDLFSPGQASKCHALLAFASPVGAYAIWTVRQDISSNGQSDKIFTVLVRVLAVINILWAKEHHVASLPTLYQLVAEVVCMVERHLPCSCRDINLHELVEMVPCIHDLGKNCPQLMLCG